MTKVEENEWKSFLDKYGDSTIYHTPEWRLLLQRTFNYKSNYIFAKDDCGEIVGFLPLFYINSKLTGNRLCSVPFSHICSPIGNKEVFNCLIDETVSIFDSSDAKFIEIRDHVDSNNFVSQNSFSTYILDVSKNRDELWANMSRSTRHNINKSKKKGTSVRVTRNYEDLKQFYELNCITKRKIGVPCHPWKFFKNLFDIFKENVSLYVVEYDGEIIAGGIRDFYHDTVSAKYAASNPKFTKLYPYNALNWKCIEDASNNGYKYYDLGRVSYDNKGLIFFKQRWGAVEKRIFYSFYPKNPMSLTENRDNLKYKIGTNVIKKIPMPIYQKLSNEVFGNFG
ncbi:peptidoglycan bridge formation glycyltransferase FemA/FemB family protein [Methanococcoides orientis]|uniref:lipid II:glycine glycyltransferase FemX n=1 Tax=Methanococcoides orientis TaxID=2822137 RepID=UPI001E4CDFF9|nr:GNAT family N-acetyltransferase [Methanococcoides orientis]UGV40614.1 peptidoglycan bridge formation glycyltransferase FemA/FemB family protein [Methanococcoides orientis]